MSTMVMRQTETTTVLDDDRVQCEFRDYLDRAAGCAASEYGGVLTLEEFRTALARWDREYHPAWMCNDRARMQELENTLLLNA